MQISSVCRDLNILYWQYSFYNIAIHIYIYIYMCVRVCVCRCVCACGPVREFLLKLLWKARAQNVQSIERIEIKWTSNPTKLSSFPLMKEMNFLSSMAERIPSQTPPQRKNSFNFFFSNRNLFSKQDGHIIMWCGYFI